MSEFVDEQKRRTLLQLLDQGLVMLHLDPRRPGVVVPSRFTADPVLRLNIAYGFNLPGLEIDREGVYAVLSFQRQDFACTLPWAAIFAMTRPDEDHEGTVWPDSMPAELDPFFESATAEAEEVPPETADAPPPGAGLRVIPGGEDAPSSAGDPDPATAGDAAPPAPSGRPKLRLVED